MEPNDNQREVIDADGTVLVDAGAGTGKTFTVTRRIERMIEDGMDPDAIGMITFTNNAADEMTQRLAERIGTEPARRVTINTFHGLSHRILQDYGSEAPGLFGLDGTLDDPDLLPDTATEDAIFRDFWTNHYDGDGAFTRLFDRPEQAADLIRKLAARGIYPTDNGWYADGDEYLRGNNDAFLKRLEEANQPRSGGSKQSELRSDLYGYKDKLHTPDAPTEDELRSDAKTASRDRIVEAFHEDREALEAFVHDLYKAYVTYQTANDDLTFSNLLMFTYGTLCERPAVREACAFDELMIDEFQDTSEIQFRLGVLLSSTGNITAVGDYKQSIYSFQYANVENITAFEREFNRHYEALSDRVAFDWTPGEPESIELTRNYRSKQPILDLAEETLTFKATRYERMDDADTIKEGLVSLRADRGKAPSTIKGYRFSEDDEASLLVDQLDKQLSDRDPSGIAVLCRNRSDALAVQSEAQNRGVPAVYEGGEAIFRSEPGVMTLAWLRVIEDDNAEAGWAVIGEENNNTPDQTREWLDDPDSIPDRFHDFATTLADQSLADSVETIHDGYDYDDPTARAIREVTANLEEAGVSRSAAVGFIERELEDPSTYDVDHDTDGEYITIRTVHGAKGSEFDCVYIHGINSRTFPSQVSDSNPVDYDPILGLRQRKIYSPDEQYVFSNWAMDAIAPVVPSDYDEERRLLYVATTRARDAVYFTATRGNESRFFDGLADHIDVETIDAEPANENGTEDEPTEQHATTG